MNIISTSVQAMDDFLCTASEFNVCYRHGLFYVLPRIDDYPKSISEDAEEATCTTFYAHSLHFVFSFIAYYIMHYFALSLVQVGHYHWASAKMFCANNSFCYTENGLVNSPLKNFEVL